MKSIVIDADAATGVARFDFDHHLSESQRFDLSYAGPGFAYLLRPGAKKNADYRSGRRLGRGAGRSPRAAKISRASRSIRLSRASSCGEENFRTTAIGFTSGPG